MHALTEIIAADPQEPFWRGLGRGRPDDTQGDPILVQLRALLALHGLLPTDGALAAAPYGQDPLMDDDLRLPKPACRRAGARRLAVWREGHRTLKALARQARLLAARPATKGSDAAQAQALLARLRWAIAAFEARRPFVTGRASATGAVPADAHA